jgi:hypothetical protein
MPHTPHTILFELSRAYLDGRMNRECYVEERTRVIDEITGDAEQGDTIRIDKSIPATRMELARRSMNSTIQVSIWLAVLILLTLMGWYYLG